MAINATESFNKALTLFGSLYQDMSPSDLPEGLSPDNQDVWYLPGLVRTRPAFTRELATPLSANRSIISLGEFPSPSGIYYTLFLDSLGQMHGQNTLTGGVFFTSVMRSIPGAQFKQENAFDKSWFAFYGQSISSAFSANPFAGCDIPRYLNAGLGPNRVTSDAPAQAPTAGDITFSSVILASPTGLVQVTGTIAPTGLSMVGNVLTVVLTAPSQALSDGKAGDPFTITGATNAGYDIEGTISQIISDTTFQAILFGPSGLPASGNGTASFGLTNVTFTDLTPFGVGNLGSLMTIAGADNAAYDGTWEVRAASGGGTTVAVLVNISALVASGGGSIAAAGNITAGGHSGVLMFLSMDGALTAPSIPFSWTSQGTVTALINGVLLGPPNTAQRVLAFTPAGGQNFYYLNPSIIPATASTAAIVSQGTVINDNTSTQIIVDFSDQQLAAGIQIDIDGNNLFNQIVLAPCLGVIEYQGRLAWWGEINNIKNFQNMAFDGGYLPPLASATVPAWSTTGSTGGTGKLVQSGVDATLGDSYQMTSAHGLNDCMLSQSCYQDYYGAPIIQQNIPYIFRCLVSPFNVAAGSLVAEVYSPSLGSLGGAIIALAGLPNNNFAWVSGTLIPGFGLAVVPSDAVFRFYLRSVTNGAVVTVDELEVINAIQPVLAQQLRVSYFVNPFGYDEISGLIGFNTTESIVAVFEQRGALYPISDRSLFVTQDNGTTEPNGWTASKQATDCGAFGPNAAATEKSLAYWVGPQGFQIFSGDYPEKISQEIQPTMDAVNLNDPTSVWLMNDSIERQVYMGLPENGAASPNLIVPMSYRALRAAYNVPDPMHVSYSGKLIGTELSRKFTRWNASMDCAAVLHRQTAQGIKPIACFAGGNFGEFYSLTFAKKTDDDFGQINSYYTSYFLFVHDQEESLPTLGSHRHLYSYLTAFVSGVGLVQITPYLDALTNPWAGRPLATYNLQTNPTRDLGWGVNITAERVAFKIAAVPIPVANITGIKVRKGIATIYAANGFAPNMQVELAGLTSVPGLNGTMKTVTAGNPKQFSFAYAVADLTGTETGTATLQPSADYPSPLTDAAFSLQHICIAGHSENVFPLASIL